MLEVMLTLANGHEYELTGHETTSQVLAPEEALRPLVGQAVRTDMALPARSGVLAGRRRYGAIQAEIPFYLHAKNGEEMVKLYKEFRQGWRLHDDPDAIPCEIQVNADRPGGPYSLEVYLDTHIPGVDVNMSTRTSASLPISLFSPTGLYRSPTKTGTGTVTITNDGDAEIYPRLKVPAAGGTVTAPSGATYTLPTQATTIDTDPQRLRTPGILPESVTPGRSAMWRLSAGVALEWESLVADPWA